MLGFDRYCDVITAQSELLVTQLAGADLRTPVPSCPEWNLGQLLRHLGGAQRWATEIIRTGQQADEDLFDMRDLSRFTDEDPAVVLPWLRAAGTELAEMLRKTGPGVPTWTPAPGQDSGSDFFARRGAHETAVHRADAVLAMGKDYWLESDVAADAVEEWLELGHQPPLVHGTLAFEATDTVDRWAVGQGGSGPATVTVRGPVATLLLVIYRRLPTASVEVSGDARPLQFWLDRVSFG
ncbi:maleylpyruvate isomerase family mycothiol-dependent enzyme [Pseudonocardiaceae bacterium YIM PH 21723]|nr:maleylpyruvate isomerase family mycothiol-dependent enzyme [Pseudonocardiaceae bacterium YIM PH 21723]